MPMPPIRTYGALAALALGAACSTPMSGGDSGGAPVETRSPFVDTAAGGGSAGRTPQSQVATVDLSQGTAAGRAGAGGTASASMAAAAQRIVYFDYDSFAIRDEFKPTIDGHAKALAANKSRRITIEGHTDERGGREYNLALGQKRADAVAKSLELLGVGDAQIEAVSFGKERPQDAGHDEGAWAKNRRAELKDR